MLYNKALLAAVSGISLALATACAAPSAGIQGAAVEMTEDAIIADMLSRMTLEDKVAQLIMPDISTITPADVRQYRFGTILNGGNSGPGGNDKAPPQDWLALADAFWEASTAPLPDGRPVIPVLWATDAVHGNANVPGATIFPHNIGLGAAGDTDLLRRIGAATAAEVAVTGLDWTFAPTLAVATDDRWGRTYESFAEDPDLVGRLGAAQVIGLQGQPGSAGYLDQTKVIATAKHFFGDGGTGGKDRGDTRGDLAQLKAVHAAPYIPAFEAGAETVMASFNSVNGGKMHGNGPLLDGYLRGDRAEGGLGFEGLVVGDWNGHGELQVCTNTDCPQSLMAGLDIFMVPEDWKGLYENTLAQVRDGTIPMARLDEAVGRVLRLKLRYGAFTKPRPSARALAGQWDIIGGPEHRAIAREAVRKSLVMMKNNGVLPLKAGGTVLVTGPGADSIPMQSGGWSITWQGGGDLTNADFPGATSIYAGIADAMMAGGGRALLSPDGNYGVKPDVAVVVFGEEPYAEFVGDRTDLAFRGEGLEMLERYKAAGIPTVAVFLSGRPMWVAREMAAADAFVAAWLPGSEGQGVADVLVGTASGAPRHDFAGRLSFGWPRGCAPNSAVAFPFGFGGTYAAAPAMPALDMECDLLDPMGGGALAIFERGLGPVVRAGAEGQNFANFVGSAGPVRVTAFDRNAQEDARRVTFSGPGAVRFSWAPVEAKPGMAVSLTYRLNNVPAGPVMLEVGGGRSIDLTSTFRLGAGKDWRTMIVPLDCARGETLDGITIRSGAAFEFEMASLAILPHAGDEDCAGPF